MHYTLHISFPCMSTSTTGENDVQRQRFPHLYCRPCHHRRQGWHPCDPKPCKYNRLNISRKYHENPTNKPQTFMYNYHDITMKYCTNITPPLGQPLPDSWIRPTPQRLRCLPMVPTLRPHLSSPPVVEGFCFVTYPPGNGSLSSTKREVWKIISLPKIGVPQNGVMKNGVIIASY